MATPQQHELFGATLPQGLLYHEGFVDADEEAALLKEIEALPLQPARYKAYSARRLVASFGGEVDDATNRLRPGPPLPPFLEPLRRRAAQWAGIQPETFVHARVACYPPGTPLGWHRDMPHFDAVFGLSLAGTARLRLRRHPGAAPAGRGAGVLELELAPRSAYLLRGVARWGWQHSIAPTPALRYSITLRTPAERAAR